MPRSRSKLMRTIPESPPSTPPQETHGTHLDVDPDAKMHRRPTNGRFDIEDQNRQKPPTWSGPNLRTSGETMQSWGSSGAATAGTSVRDSATGDSQADDRSDSPVIVTTPLPDAGDPVKPYSSRFIRVDDVSLKDFDGGKPMDVLKNMPNFHEQVNKLGIFDFRPLKTSKSLPLHTLYMFSDSLALSRQMLQMLRKHFKVGYTTREGFAAADVNIPSHVTKFSGTVTVHASVKETSAHKNFTREQMSDMVKNIAARFGPIDFFQDTGMNTETRTIKVFIEYDSVNDAADAILNTRPGDDILFGRHEHLHIFIDNDEFAQRDPSPATPGVPKDPLTYSPTGRTAWVDTPSGKTMTYSGYIATPSTSRGQHGRHSRQTSREMPQNYIYQEADLLKGMKAYSYLPPPGQGFVGQGFVDGQGYEVGHKPQDVILPRIQSGLDVRTTLMIRNIPPEFTADDLKKLLDGCVAGQYDFSYNRIDFRQNQAVGYAFVNFTSTNALTAFVTRWRGRLLPRNVYRRHQKPCDVSYANIQGLECLIAKFRNSSILDEAATCRPKLFYTTETAPTPALIGTEREFPGVDNQAKKNRSLQNAHVNGLYTPRPRSNGRGRGRRGYSQFDRGTSAQQHDERQYAMNYQYGGSTMPNYGQYSQPRYQPGVQHGGQNGFDMPSPTPVAVPSMLRSFTNGNLGSYLPSMPAYVAPVWDSSQVVLHHQGDFEPLLTPIKGQTSRNFRRVN